MTQATNELSDKAVPTLAPGYLMAPFGWAAKPTWSRLLWLTGRARSIGVLHGCSSAVRPQPFSIRSLAAARQALDAHWIIYPSA